MLRTLLVRAADRPEHAASPIRPQRVARAVTLGVLLTAATGCAAWGQDSAAVRSRKTALTLPMVIEAAAQSHPLALAAEGRLRAARGNRVTAGTLANPVLTYQVENAPFPGRAGSAALQRETSAYATLPLEALWQRGARVGRANQDVEAAEADVVQTRRLVALDAARAFHRAALAQASVIGSREVTAGLDSLVRYTTARVREGATAEGDLLRLQVERDRVATETALQEAELAQAVAVLQPYLASAMEGPVVTTAGMALEDVLDADEASAAAVRDTSMMPMASLDGVRGRMTRERLAMRALDARPDVLAARARTRAASSDVSLQRALRVRQLGATFGSKSTAGMSSMIAGFAVPLPLFDRNRGEVQRAQGERTAVEQELRWTERRAAAEVLGAYDAADILTTRVIALRVNFLARALESRRVALAAYREGAVPLLQILDATRTLADARLIYLRARFAQQDAILELYVAAGLDPAAALPITASTRGTAP